ncbi:MAG: GldG family protein [Burkholderiales bacterium]
MSSFRAGMILLLGVALVAAAAVAHTILMQYQLWTGLVAFAGAALIVYGASSMRRELAGMLGRRRGEIALQTLGGVGVICALAYLSVLAPLRFDLTTAKRFSLSEQTVKMLRAVDKPVKITFFHDPMMRETVELYQLMVRENKNLSLVLHDPVLNPAQARLMNVQFAGTAILESEDRKITINGPSETDISNGILRASQGKKQLVCFLDGHGEADAFSQESHDHMEGAAGHSHGMGTKVVLHQQHGMAKARQALESMNYSVEKIALVQTGHTLKRCALLVVAGPKIALLKTEVESIRAFLREGGNGFFLLDPFVKSGLEAVVAEYSMVLDDDIVIDETNHFWADPSAPAVTNFNFHQVTRELPLTFFPGARSISPTPDRVPGTSAIPLVNSSKQSYGETTPDRAQFNEGADLKGPLTLMAVAKRSPGMVRNAAEIMANLRGDAPSPGDTEKELTDLEKLKSSRLVVAGDSDFATNSFFHLLGNGKLFLNAVNYLASQESLIGIEPRTFDVPRVNLTNQQMKGTFFLSLVLIPALLAVIGIAVWWKQR